MSSDRDKRRGRESVETVETIINGPELNHEIEEERGNNENETWIGSKYKQIYRRISLEPNLIIEDDVKKSESGRGHQLDCFADPDELESLSTISNSNESSIETETETGSEEINLPKMGKGAQIYPQEIDKSLRKPKEIFSKEWNWTQVSAALSVSLCSLIVGFGTAYTSPALPSMARNDTSFSLNILQISSQGEEASWIGSLLPLGGLVGGLLGFWPLEKYGRKFTILMTAVPFLISWILIGFAVDIWMIYIGRAVIGFCIGIASLSLPIYLAEIVHPEIRGILGLFPTTIGNIGILICYVGGMLLNWRNLAFLGGLLSMPFFICTLIFVPETPRWQIAHDKEDEAEKSLLWLRKSSQQAKEEFFTIKKSHEMSLHQKISLRNLCSTTYAKPILIALGLMLFQQLSGVNAIVFYTVDIFKKSGSTIDENLSTIIVGLVNLGAVFIANILIDRLGRKVLLIVSESLMILCLSILSMFFYFKENSDGEYDEALKDLGWIPLVCVLLYILAFSLGFGPVPWLMLGEIFPGNIRDNGASISTAFNWTCTFIVTKFFPGFLSYFGSFFTFLVFNIICFCGLFFVIFCVPETKGLSLEQIENYWYTEKRRKSSLVDFQPIHKIHNPNHNRSMA